MTRKRILLCISILIIFCLALPAFSWAGGPGDPVWEQRAWDAIKKSQEESKEKHHRKVTHRLTDLEDVYKKGGEEEAKKFAKERGLRLKEGNKIKVYIRLKPEVSVEQFDISILQAYGIEIIDTFGHGYAADIPINMIRKVADEVEDIIYIELPKMFVPSSYQGEGESLTGAHSYHLAGITGAGVKVAVIDAGFAGLSGAIQFGDLPANVVKIDCTWSSCISSTFSSETNEHGTAVAEVVYDMAEGAQLYLIKIADDDSFKRAVTYCVGHDLDIINLSGGWYNQNFYDGQCYNDNAVCSVNSANNSGIFWVNAAGNEANSHYYATSYTPDPNNPGWHNVIPEISANIGEPIEVHFTWNAWSTTNQDYDIYLMDDKPVPWIVAKSENRQTGSEEPVESFSVTAPYTGTYYLFIASYWSDENHRFHVFSLNHNLNPAVSSRSIFTPADAAGAVAVGAIPESLWPTTGQIAGYSSQGPTGDGRKKPDISGPTNVSTYTRGTKNFSGTSAAAPHVAGAAALIKQLTGYGANDLRNALTGWATPTGSPIPNNVYGYGRLNLPSYTLLVSKVIEVGAGGGTITSSPAGILCGTDCSNIYLPGTAVTLTAQAGECSNFAGWGVVCPGTEPCTVTMNKNISVGTLFEGVAPVADFSSAPLSGPMPLLVNFADMSTCSPTSWSWNFGDGVTDSQQNPSHVYANAGTYSVSLTASNARGSNTKTKTNYITAGSCSNSPIKILGSGSTFTSLQAAYNAALAGDTILSHATIFNETISMNRAINVTLSGGYDCTFANQIGNTRLKGDIQVTNGPVKIGNFKIEK